MRLLGIGVVVRLLLLLMRGLWWLILRLLAIHGLRVCTILCLLLLLWGRLLHVRVGRRLTVLRLRLGLLLVVVLRGWWWVMRGLRVVPAW